MNLQQALTAATKKLSHLENPSLEAEVLLATLLEKNRTWLKTYPEKTLTDTQQSQFNQWIKKRAEHMPSSYITGTVNWNGLRLKVNKHTLIPRDETETLCHHIKEGQTITPRSILDVGTGSGCIAIWLSQQYPQAGVTALDVSSPAVETARGNQLPSQKIKFIESDMLNVLESKDHYDLIVANLPYVPDTLKVSPEVSQEPRSAIFSGNDGLDHIRTLATQIIKKEMSFNQLWLEFLPNQIEAITAIFDAYAVKPYRDVNGEIYFAQISPLA
jgi:release factor glutamine methyltransferase